jgi:two-component system, NarL family, nitrate/nitrite response regulator NarL
MSDVMVDAAPQEMDEVLVGRPLTLLVVDPHPVVQQGVRQFLGASARIDAVDGAATGADAIEAARRTRPDVALVDTALPDMVLGELSQRLRASSPNTRLVAFAAQITPTLRERAVELGLHGLISKGAEPDDLIATIARVAGGEVVHAPESDEVLRQAAEKLHCGVLTAREHEILRRAARGSSNSEIAAEIFLAPTTVKSYLQSALSKLGARNRVEAVFKLGEAGLL